jgi:ubiquinol-cytochrome c reductase cytochrome b subunit
MYKYTQNNLIQILFNHLKTYPTPSNLNYFWNFGSLSGICLGIQIISGVFLAMHYSTSAILSFDSVEHIMRDVSNGWFLRYLHANGASMFFVVLYLHIARGLYYNSYHANSKLVWLSGMAIFLLTMAVAFIGYVLPWGQMSYWGATVITNMFSALPVIGIKLVYWLWGGFAVGEATLNRFFSLHFLLPFLIVFLVLVHISQLHEIGSSNPFPLDYNQYNVANSFFYPYFAIKDLLGLLIFLMLFAYFIYFVPNYLGHSDNYIEANPLVTPEHIVPEWYFLPFYAILRSIPDKLGGILFMLGSILFFFILPFTHQYIINSLSIYKFNYANNLFIKNIIWSIYFIFLLLGWLGSQPVEEPFISIGLYGSLILLNLTLLI